jgi:rubrerythrin
MPGVAPRTRQTLDKPGGDLRDDPLADCAYTAAMQQVYSARDDMDANFLKGLLEQEGIACVIQGQMLEGTWGTMPVTSNSLPSVWVDEADLARAEPIVAEYVEHERQHAQVGETPPRPTWKCPACGEAVEEQFDQCWNCGADKPASSASAAGQSPSNPEAP